MLKGNGHGERGEKRRGEGQFDMISSREFALEESDGGSRKISSEKSPT